jgi:hypothetical protein
MKVIDLEIHGPYVFIELDAKVEAEFVKFFGSCSREDWSKKQIDIICVQYLCSSRSQRSSLSTETVGIVRVHS